MKRYLKDFLVGFVIGALYFFGSTLLDLEFLGSDLYTRLGLGGVVGLIVFGFWFVILGVLPFIVYVVSPLYRKDKLELKSLYLARSFTFFSSGIYASFLLWLLFMLFAISQISGPGF
jgi:hypothetical protein